LIVANDVSEPESIFGSDTNVVTFIPREGEPVNWPRMSKREIANAILEYVMNNLWEAPV